MHDMLNTSHAEMHHQILALRSALRDMEREMKLQGEGPRTNGAEKLNTVHTLIREMSSLHA